MEIVEITSTECEHFKAFEEVKKHIYSANELIRLSSSNPFNNPFFYKAFGAIEGGNYLAHAVLYNNPLMFYNGFKAVCIGNYESVENGETAEAFLRHIIYEAKIAEAEYLIGPMNGSTWENYRFADLAESEYFFLEPYNKTYYNWQFQLAGFEKIASYFSTADKSLNYNSNAAIAREKELIGEGLTIRNININDFENELAKIYELCLEAFADNFLYTPISWENFSAKYFSAMPYMDKNFVLMAEEKDGKLAGFIFCLKNIFNANADELIIKTIARKKGRKYRGLGDILGKKITLAAKEKGYTSIIHALMYSQNASLSLSKKYSGEVFKTYSLYAAKT